MLLSWNYTLELFFWIIIAAVALVSLTILLAGGRFRTKKTKVSEETLSLTGQTVASPKTNAVDRGRSPTNVEEEVEVIESSEESRDESAYDWNVVKAAVIILSYMLFSLLTIYIGLSSDPNLSSDFYELDRIFSFILKWLLIVSGFVFYYGFYQNNLYLLKISGRVIAFIFFIRNHYMIISSNFDNETFLLFGFVSLWFSGDLKIVLSKIYGYLKNVLSKIYGYDNQDVSLWWVGVPAGVLCLFLVIAIFGPFGFVLISATVIIVTIYINLN